MRLRQPLLQPKLPQGDQREPAIRSPSKTKPKSELEPEPEPLTEFESYVATVSGLEGIRRFGVELFHTRGTRDFEMPEADSGTVAPEDYILSPGDELTVSMWGSVDADLRLPVDNAGRIFIPRIGAISVGGMRYVDVRARIDQQVRRTFKNFELQVGIGKLRGVRVYVTGFVSRPGLYPTNSLASVTSVLFSQAGGPSASGSFRDIELRRSGKTIARIDLYELLVSGQRRADLPVQAGDIIHVGPVGRQVALIGSVNKAAIFELKPDETIGQLIEMGGGLSSVADPSRLSIESIADRNGIRVREMALGAARIVIPSSGDVIRAYSSVLAAQPFDRQNKRVRIEGEVLRPGEYIMSPGATSSDAIALAGGLTANAHIYAAEFNRESVRVSQQASFERALRDLELEFTRKGASTAARTAADAEALSMQQANTEKLLLRLRERQPTGRVVLPVEPSTVEFPLLPLEDGDRLYIPPRPTTIGVFGSIFNSGSFVFTPGRTVNDYLRLAGSMTTGADRESVFVIRANGSVVSAQQDRRLWTSGTGNLGEQVALAGDVIFVPEVINRQTFTQSVKDWTTVLYQLGIGLAGFNTFLK